MKRPTLPSIAAGCLAVFALLAGNAQFANAQTFQWHYVTHTPNEPPLDATSTVAIERGDLTMQYTVPIGGRQVVIESCHAATADVGSASTIQTQGRVFLLVQMKPGRSARCDTGSRPAVALPTDSEGKVAAAIAAVNRICCAVGTVAAAPAARPAVSGTPAAAPSATPRAPSSPPATPRAPSSPAPSSSSAPTPEPSPSPSPSPTPARRVGTADWVERTGRIWFVRARNVGDDPVRVRDIVVDDCSGVAYGCGSPSPEILLDPGQTATLATLAAADPARKPTFRYRYRVVRGARTLARTGSSSSAAPPRAERISPAQIRLAEAHIPAAIAADVIPPAGTLLPPRLLKRGSSRLAIGVRGTALVRLMIGPSGTPEEATIVNVSDRRLSAAAIETAVSSTYAPATLNGKPIAAKYVATFGFDGEDPALAGIPVWKRSPSPVPSPPPVPSPSSGTPTVTAPAPSGSAPASTPPPPPVPAEITPVPSPTP